MIGTKSGELIYTGTKTASSGGAYLQPIGNSAGVYDIAVDKFDTNFDLVLGIGSTLPTTPGVVTIYYRYKISTDTYSDYYYLKQYQTPSLASTTIPIPMVISRSWSHIKVYADSCSQDYTIALHKRSWDV